MSEPGTEDAEAAAARTRQRDPLLAAEADRRAQALAGLARVERETETVGASNLQRAARPTASSDDDERIVLWGKRIGRSLGVAVALFLVWKLVEGYLLASGPTHP